MKGVFDTNIIIDYLAGYDEAKKEIELFETKIVSIITYIEVLVGIDDEVIAASIKEFFNRFDVVNIDKNIADVAIEERKKYRLKIPDSLILATAKHLNALLVTRDKKDFPVDLPIVRIPYQL